MARRLSRRSQQVLDLLYQRGEASAAEILAALSDMPSYSAVRSILRSLEGQGLVRHREENLRYVYSPRIPRAKASRGALRQLIDTFFDGRPEPALESLIDLSRDGHYQLDYDRLQQLIDAARREGR